MPFRLSCHPTHILKSLDIMVFQHYKHYYAKALNQLAREDTESITKFEFLSEIEQVRFKPLKRLLFEAAPKSQVYTRSSQPLYLTQLKSNINSPRQAPQTSLINSSSFSTPQLASKLATIGPRLIDATGE